MNYTNLNQNINIYFKEIRSNSSMTRADEITLFTRISNGDQSARTEVFNKMAKLAVAVAKTYTDKACLLQDLIQEANYGILTAIDKYDLSLGFRFSSYARWWMKSSITTFLNELGIVHPSSPRIPTLVKKISEEFYKTNHRSITEYELMDALEEQGEIITDISAILAVKVDSIDDQVSSDSDKTVEEIGEFADRTQSYNEYEKKVEEESIQDEISRRMARLTSREQTLVRLRFGFITGNEMDYESVTKEWNKVHPGKESLTQERVRQLVVAALKKMK